MVDLKRRSDLHTARKIWHLLTVGIMAYVYTHVSWKTSVYSLLVVCTLFIPLDLLRQSHPSLNKILLLLFKKVMRDHEAHHIAGTTYLLTGVLVVVLIFPHSVTTLTLLFLAFADPIASFVGILYGKDKLVGSKSLQGTLAAFLVCTLLSAAYFSLQNLMTGRLLLTSLLAGLAGALSELIPIRGLDDNLTFPLFSASCLWLILSIFGGLL